LIDRDFLIQWQNDRILVEWERPKQRPVTFLVISNVVDKKISQSISWGKDVRRNQIRKCDSPIICTIILEQSLSNIKLKFMFNVPKLRSQTLRLTVIKDNPI
jgi:hypothetical protein